MMDAPKTIAEINKLINDKVQESLHLEYKDSRAAAPGQSNEISKDTSAFANSDGGIIIYGVQEDKKHFPIMIDIGIDHSTFSHERLEQIIHGNITPRVDDLRIYPIPLSIDRSIYVVQMPKSYRGPHQAADKKYYKRFNFLATAMEDYEINDIRNRRLTLSPLVNIDIQTKGRTMVYLVVSNIGEMPAQDVTFKFSEELEWHNGREAPGLFKNGVKYLPPRRSYYFFYNTFMAAFNKETGVASSFDVEVSYLHPQITQRVSDTFHIDLMDYRDSTLIDSEESEVGKKMVDSLKELKNEIGKLNNHLESISSIAGATGLNVSIPTLKNLGHLLANDGRIEKINPVYLRAQGFKEILSIDDELAYELQSHFMSMSSDETLRKLNGMTDEIMEKVKKHFIISDEE
jgi:predicted HTH transcriptional regulator